ncbi:MAG: DUF91 domain-containing protein [Dechloromonas sp.]|nr:DUF91 domain-containing protein [Dechloromonas sp.]
MTIYSVNNDALTPLKKTTFSEQGVRERQNLQQWIKKNISVLGEDLLVIAEEFSQWDSSKRLDLLAVDQTGNLVIIELKRDESGAHAELQALRYAAMASTMRFSQAVQTFTDYLQRNGADSSDAKSTLLKFINAEDDEPENFAGDTRIILVAAEFSKELSTTVMFLNERNIDIRCIRMVPHSLPDGTLLLDAQQTIPLPESKDYQIQVWAKAEERRKAIESSTRDNSKYLFKNAEYGKGRLVQAVVAAYLNEHPEISYEVLSNVFPGTLQGSNGVFTTLLEHTQRLQRDHRSRYFGNETEILKTADNQQIVVCSQWGAGNIDSFIRHAEELGFQITKRDRQ